jgi:hypothetical protein
MGGHLPAMVPNETEASLSRPVLVDCSIYTKSAPTYALALLLDRSQTRDIIYPSAIAGEKTHVFACNKPRRLSLCPLAAPDWQRSPKSTGLNTRSLSPTLLAGLDARDKVGFGQARDAGEVQPPLCTDRPTPAWCVRQRDRCRSTPARSGFVNFPLAPAKLHHEQATHPPTRADPRALAAATGRHSHPLRPRAPARRRPRHRRRSGSVARHARRRE